MTIHKIHAANPGSMTGAGNWTYLLDGRVPVLIDAGVGRPTHLDSIAEVCPAGPRNVIVTHGHGDHASGGPAIAARWPAARFTKWASSDGDAVNDVPWSFVADGDRIPAGDDDLQVVHTPGHAPDHIALWHEPSRTLFGGDLLVQGSTVVIPASSGGSLAAYLQSLKRVLALSPARVLPAHGPEIDRPGALVQQYLDHRQQREAQITGALAAGLTSVEAIAARIYEGLGPALTSMARETVLAHLIKLEEDGRAGRTAVGWYLRG